MRINVVALGIETPVISTTTHIETQLYESFNVDIEYCLLLRESNAELKISQCSYEDIWK